MENNILKRFNLSYSAWSVFKDSPLQGYFAYIEKADPTDTGYPVYGIAGNVVHHAVEDYINLKGNTFENRWNNSNIENMTGIRGAKISKESFQNMYNSATTLIDVYKKSSIKYNLIPEMNFNFKFHGMTIKGQIDLVVKHDDKIITLLDWKTNSTNTYKMHRDQRLFYTWAICKTTGQIPKSIWWYLKKLESHKDEFTEDDLIKFENKIIEFIDEIKEKGYDIDRYEPGNWKGPFNNYTTLCANEVQRRLNKTTQKITLEIKGHFVFLKGNIDPILEQGIDIETKFDLKNKYYMQKVAREKRTRIVDVTDVGTMHLYIKKFKCFPIGLMETVKTIINEYFEFYNKKGKIEIIDNRDECIMNQCLLNFSDDVKSFMKLRDYQIEAMESFFEKENGIIQIATGGGKTFVASEIIRTLDGKTLWICDRKELLKQTKEALEKQLGMEIGIISGSDFKICDITIATIQSLHSKLAKIKDYLYTVNFVIVDEFHKAAAETYQKVFAKIPNTKYRLGLTATPTRDDGKEPVLKSILGDVIYKITSKDLIAKGYLVKPEIKFIDITKTITERFSTYPEEYLVDIIDNEERNNKILQICQNNLNKKILILTKSVEHGKQLKTLLLSYGGEMSMHIYGSLNKELREQYYNNFVESDCKILILTLSIGAEGLDIPDLDVVINAAANKGDVKSVQVLGRVLRTFEGKKEAIYYDFIDSGKWTKKHSIARMKALKSEGHNITIIK